LFVARRERAAGAEPRLKPVIHPEMFKLVATRAQAADLPLRLEEIERGRMTVGWYLRTPIRAMAEKIRRRLS
jgi:hypothetical protein